MELGKSCCHHPDTENLRTLEPYVQVSRKEAFRNLRSVMASSTYVPQLDEETPAHLTHCGGRDKVLSGSKVHGGYRTTQAESQEHAYPCVAILRRGKPTYFATMKAEMPRTHDGGAEELKLWGAAEGRIEPGDI